MVDFVRNEVELAGILIWPGCNELVATSVHEFLRRCGPYSTQSCRYSIYTLFIELIDPAWRIYLSGQTQNDLQQSNFSELKEIGDVALKKGFWFAENALREWVRTVHKSKNVSSDFQGTLATLIDLVSFCRTKKPQRSRRTEHGVNSRRVFSNFCKFCGNATELYSLLTTKNWPVAQDEDHRAKLSTKYCNNHRPRNLDGTWNSVYLRAKRNVRLFEKEALKQRKLTGTERHLEPKDIVDQFDFDLAERLGAYPDEEEKYLNAARTLVNSRINDRKKQIIMLLAAGKKQIDIAAELGISKQAVSKAIKSIPAQYRFDLPQDHRA